MLSNDPHEYVQGVLAGDRRMLSKTITLIESSLPAHQETARLVIDKLLSDERYGERVCAFVILRRDGHLELPEVLAHFEREGVARQKTPERLISIDELPQTPSGKVKKFELRERLRSL